MNQDPADPAPEPSASLASKARIAARGIASLFRPAPQAVLASDVGAHDVRRR